MLTSWRIACVCVVGGALTAGVGCGDSTGTGTTTGSGGGGTGGGGTTTATTGSGGAGGGCNTCSELVLGNLPPTQACPGTSTTLVTNLVTCLCAECGQPGAGGGGGAGGGAAGPCFPACTQAMMPDAACLACDQAVSAAGQPCETVMEACLADQ